MKRIGWIMCGIYFFVTGILTGIGLIYVAYLLGAGTFGKTPNFWTLFIAGFGVLILGTTAIVGFAQSFIGWMLWKQAAWAKKIAWLLLAAHSALFLLCLQYWFSRPNL